MKTMTEISPSGIIIGVDTHRDVHVAAALDGLGRELDVQSFASDTSGYRQLVEWASSHGAVAVFGIEGTGSWGAGLARYVSGCEYRCIEVNRTNRQHRRRHGKSDPADAVAAARAVIAGTAKAQPRGHDGPIESLRTIRIAHRSAVKARTQAINQLRAVITTAPEPLKKRFVELNRRQLVTTCRRLRPQSSTRPSEIAKITLRSLAKRIEYLDQEIAELNQTRDELVKSCAPPELLAEHGIATAVAADLLIAIGDNPHRITTEAGFAALCGVSPVDASSGRQQRHRLNRGGDRQANNALWRIIIVRLATHQETRDYFQRALANGKTKREAIRTLKRYLARRIWRLLQRHPLQLDQ